MICQEVCAEQSSKTLTLRAATSLSASDLQAGPALDLRHLPVSYPFSPVCPTRSVLTWGLFALDCCQLIHFNILAWSQICFLLPPNFLQIEFKFVLGGSRVELVLKTHTPTPLGGRDQPHHSALLPKLSESEREFAYSGLKTLGQNCTPTKAMNHKYLVSNSLW